MTPAHARPPRLVVKTMAATFVTTALVLAAVFVVVTMDTRRRVVDVVTANLSRGQDALARFNARRERELAAQAESLVESPTLKAALDTYESERRDATASTRAQLVATLRREVEKIAGRISADAIVITDLEGRVVVSAGHPTGVWEEGSVAAGSLEHPATIKIGGGQTDALLIDRAGGTFQAIVVPLTLHDEPLGRLMLVTNLDAAYVQELSTLLSADTALFVDGSLRATTLDRMGRDALAARGERSLGRGPSLVVDGEALVVRAIHHVGPATVYALASLDAAAAPAMAEATRSLAFISITALGLTLLASLWLARSFAGPVNDVSRRLAAMAGTGRFDSPLPSTRSSRELAAMTASFNQLLSALRTSEADREAAFSGTIRALATALDARDPLTAGHSERVSAIAVRIARELGLSAEENEVLRLGALLHDIGKIGVPDAVLQKPGLLTDEEYALIRTHPVVGARILRSVPFFGPHLPIVELHHERPDGRGYPYGLIGDETPLAARIVHVADTFDAITSARAYRSARSVADALDELWRGAGTDFDPSVVEALSRTLTSHGGASRRAEPLPERAVAGVDSDTARRSPTARDGGADGVSRPESKEERRCA